MKRKSTRALRPSAYKRTEAFLLDFTRGLSGEELRRLFDRDAKGAYSVLMRDREAQVEKVSGLKRYLLAAKLLFLSLSEKLSPRRRLLFGLAIVAAVAGIIDPQITWVDGDRHGSVGGSSLLFLVAIVLLLLLLAFEMVDRVLVRDEIQIARQLQRELLPKASPDLAGYGFAHSSRTANDIGGDYYKFHLLPDGRMAIVVADASGHGMAAGLLMAIADATLHIALELDPSPVAVSTLLQRAIWRTGDRRSFLTLFYALLDPATGSVEYVCAGHPFPLLRRAGGAIEEPALGSFPLGMRETVKPARAAPPRARRPSPPLQRRSLRGCRRQRSGFRLRPPARSARDRRRGSADARADPRRLREPCRRRAVGRRPDTRRHRATPTGERFAVDSASP